MLSGPLEFLCMSTDTVSENSDNSYNLPLARSQATRSFTES